MVFSSHIFVFYFLPAMLLLYYGLAWAPQRWRNLLLVVLGYIFYGWANPKFIFLMFGTTFLDWLLSLVIAGDSWRFWRRPPAIPVLPEEVARSRRQKWALGLSIVSNLTMLGFFKYFNFAIDSYNALVSSLGWDAAQWDTVFRVVLPLGISFYTFQSMSYIIDVYRGDARAMRSFIDFSCFVSMCPHLVAGPILKFSFLADQLERRGLSLEKFARGVAFFCLGMAKKILLANPCGKIADTVFGAYCPGGLDSWLGVLGYSFQIYFDFSGYSDMAIGLGLMLGFVFVRNFDSPYKSHSITDFWRRWHISLSTWLREYLYIPLGGNRNGKWRTYVNLMLTMLLGGLWHGAAWNFVIWGGIHGGMLAFERSRGKTSLYHRMPKVLRIGLTFLIVCVAWVFFRSANLGAAGRYLASMAGLGGSAGAGLLNGILFKPYYLICLVLASVVVWGCPDTWNFTRRLSGPKVVACMVLLWLAIAVMMTQEYNPFIYFIF